MFIIPTYVEKSEIEGLGVFAGRDIQKGEIVWQFDPAVDLCIPKADLEAMSGFARDHFDRYSYPDTEIYPDGYIYNADHGKYVNHNAGQPNIKREGRIYRACADIPKGREMTCDYREFDWESDAQMPAYIKGV